MTTNTDIVALALTTATAINDATVFVDRKVGLSFTSYTLTGKRPAVQNKVESLMREFSPFAYGTRVEYNETGAVVTRANSCD